MPKKTRQQALAALVTPHGTRGSDSGDGTVSTGGEPDIDASVSQLRDIIAVLPSDAIQALLRMAHAVARPSHVSDRLAEVEDLQEVVNDQLFDLLDDSGVLVENSVDLTAEDAIFWHRLFYTRNL